ncbi:MAG: isocitrate dehydrogenase (NADP(+)) [Desulfitobacteriaceae bacterium]|nr:isocitrate dehydrogenase (NADP(+)) [Desulfitobacteriaceae bacterium]MDD4346692.1 isocitrate dehydrogenase (NADP(+)) [Desulfitobacteriaceae bacterium]MDD4401141.1 isocitrate dehydrogenase (NADP(+)) [Desulfitobacteriaceae bacterium]
MSEKITIKNCSLNIPDHPIIPFIEGDGTGPDIWRATRMVVDAAVVKAYNRRRAIQWKEVLAGEKAFEQTGEWLPTETLTEIKEHIVAIKGPLTTPIGGGIRSLNVTLRQELDLFACVRPVRWFKGVASPVKHPEKVNAVIYRENTEDIYMGIEWSKDSAECARVRDFLNKEMGCSITEDSGIGVKPISKTGSERIARKAMLHALENNRKTVTFVHKGNIMKYTEGAFKDWCYNLVITEFRDKIVTEDEVSAGASREGKILVNDRIADNMFQQILTRPDEYEVIVATNLNGDYLSDAVAAQVGGLGMAPGANIGDFVGVFEATHGTAPKYAGLDKVNPGSLILSAVMMLDYIGWHEAARMIEDAIEKTIGDKTVTYDIARQMEGAKEVKTSGFAAAIIANL